MLYSIEVCKFSRLNVLFSLVNTLIMLTYHGTEGGNYIKYRDNCLLHLNKFQQGRNFSKGGHSWWTQEAGKLFTYMLHGWLIVVLSINICSSLIVYLKVYHQYRMCKLTLTPSSLLVALASSFARAMHLILAVSAEVIQLSQ